MKSLQVGLMLTVFLALAMPAQAQLFFSRKPKTDPNQRVPELIVLVKTDADERKRAHAAEELRDYDPAVFSEIVPVLVDVLLNDRKASVRTEALTSLAKIRPVSTQAGRAIEKAAADDDSVRIRLQAKAALPKYHLAGYSSKSSPAPIEKKATPMGSSKQTQEPPLADPKVAPAPIPIRTPAPSNVVPPPAPIPIPMPTPTAAKVVPPPIPIPTPAPPQAEAPSDRPIPRPFPPISVPPTKTPPPAEGPSLFP
jgi:HEAT repeats